MLALMAADSGAPASWLIDLGVQLAAGLITMILTLLIQARWIPSPHPRRASKRGPAATGASPADAAIGDDAAAEPSTTGENSPTMGDGNTAATGAGNAAVSGSGNTIAAGGGSVYNVSTVYNTVAGQAGNGSPAAPIGWALAAAGAAILLALWWPVLVAACYGAAAALIVMAIVAIVRSRRYLDRWPAGSALRVLNTGVLAATLGVLVAWLQLAPFGGRPFSDLAAALTQGVRTGLDDGVNPITAVLNATFALGTDAWILTFGTLGVVIWAAIATVVRSGLMSWLSFLRVAGPRTANQKDQQRAAQATWKQSSFEVVLVLIGCALSLFLASGLVTLLIFAQQA